MSVDVLVIGSGASGLAAAVSAFRAGARVGLATKGSLPSCNSAKAQGGIQAAFAEDDKPESYFYVCADTSSKLRASQLDGQRLYDHLTGLKCRKMIYLDTCHSGSLSSDPARAPRDTTSHSAANVASW